MWMVQISGTWQPATDAVIYDWIRNGTVGSETMVRHATRALPQPLRMGSP